MTKTAKKRRRSAARTKSRVFNNGDWLFQEAGSDAAHISIYFGGGSFGALSSIMLLAPDALTAKLTAADRAWINTCMAQRRMSKEPTTKLRKYCSCMQEIVDNNEQFDSTSALERTYPPAYEICWDKTGRK